MHAVVIRVNIGDPENAQQELTANVVPRVSEAPGFVTGYWTRKGNTGLSMTVWESEEIAREAADRLTQNMPQTVELQDFEIREVIASA